MTIKQLYIQIVPGYNLGLPGGCWTPISREKWYLCLSDLARIIFPDISRSFHIFPVYRIEKLIPGSVGVSHPVSRNFKSHFAQYPV